MKTKGEPVSTLRNDAEADVIVAKADRSQYAMSGFKPMRFEIAQKDAVLKVRLPEALMEKLRARAKEIGVPYSRYVRMVLESDLAQANRAK